MEDKTNTVPTETDILEHRAARLAAVIENVARRSKDANMKLSAQVIAERIQELLEEIREIELLDTAEATERRHTFKLRLDIAEKKISAWPLSPTSRKILSGQKKVAALAA